MPDDATSLTVDPAGKLHEDQTRYAEEGVPIAAGKFPATEATATVGPEPALHEGIPEVAGAFGAGIILVVEAVAGNIDAIAEIEADEFPRSSACVFVPTIPSATSEWFDWN